MDSTFRSPLTGLHRVRRNTIWLLGGRVVTQLALFLLALNIARFLGDEGLGAYALLTTILFVGNVFTTFGLDTFLLRQIARRGHTRRASLAPALLLQLLLSTGFIAVLLLFPPPLLAEPVLFRALLAALLSLLPLAITTVCSAALRANEEMAAVNGVLALSALGQLGAAYLLLRRGGAMVEIGLIILLGQWLVALGMLYFCYRLLPGFTFNWRRARPAVVRRLLRLGLPLALLMALGVLYQRLGVLLLSAGGDSAVLGQFAAAARLVDGARLLPYALFGALFPVMARSPGGGRIPRRYTILFFLLCGGMVLIAGLFIWLAPRLIPWLFGSGYEPAVPALRRLSLTLLPFLFSLRFSVEWVTAGYERRLVAVTLVVLLLTGLMGWWAYNRFQLTGLCLALVAGETVQALLLALLHPQRSIDVIPPVS